MREKTLNDQTLSEKVTALEKDVTSINETLGSMRATLDKLTDSIVNITRPNWALFLSAIATSSTILGWVGYMAIRPVEQNVALLQAKVESMPSPAEIKHLKELNDKLEIQLYDFKSTTMKRFDEVSERLREIQQTQKRLSNR